MIIFIDICILAVIVFMELVIVKQFWNFNLESDRLRFGKLAINEAVSDKMRPGVPIKTIEYSKYEIGDSNDEKYLNL